MIRMIRAYPFRLTALLLSVIVAVEMVMILRMPDYSAELAEAQARYEEAKRANVELRLQLSEGIRDGFQ